MQIAEVDKVVIMVIKVARRTMHEPSTKMGEKRRDSQRKGGGDKQMPAWPDTQLRRR